MAGSQKTQLTSYPKLADFGLVMVVKSPIFTVCNLRSGVPYIFCRGGKVRLIQLLEYLSVASPESGLFSDWSRNKKVLRTEP